MRYAVVGKMITLPQTRQSGYQNQGSDLEGVMLVDQKTGSPAVHRGLPAQPGKEAELIAFTQEHVSSLRRHPEIGERPIRYAAIWRESWHASPLLYRESKRW